MKRIAQFMKVSFEQYCKDMAETKEFKNAGWDFYKESYDNITLPKRATMGSAGYDFFMPFTIFIEAHSEMIIPSGIRCKINDGWVLTTYPRSGLGYRYRLSLANTVGIIDSDYYDANNEGHIIFKLINNSDNNLTIDRDKGYAQGIFIEYGITFDDNATEKRIGGFGSTSNEKK